MRVLLRCIAVVFVLSILITVFAVGVTVEGIDDAYAQWGAADLVIIYMDDHDGAWPKSWDALEPYFDKYGCHVSGWSYETFQKHIWIDFTADSTQLKRKAMSANSPIFNVIGSTRFYSPHFGVDGPNGMIHRYFNPDSPNPDPPTTATIELAK